MLHRLAGNFPPFGELRWKSTVDHCGNSEKENSADPPHQATDLWSQLPALLRPWQDSKNKFTHVVTVKDDHLPRPLPGLRHPAADDAESQCRRRHVADAALLGQRGLHGARRRRGGRGRGWGGTRQCGSHNAGVFAGYNAYT